MKKISKIKNKFLPKFKNSGVTEDHDPTSKKQKTNSGGGPKTKDSVKQQELRKAYDTSYEFLNAWQQSPQHDKMLFGDEATTGEISIANKRESNLQNFNKNPNLQLKSDLNGFAQMNWDVLPSGNYKPKIEYGANNPIDQSSVLHELSHVTDFIDNGKVGAPIIPKRDIQLMQSLYKPTAFKGKYADYDHYVKNPTEVRARLFEMRNELYKKGHNILEKGVSPAIFKSLDQGTRYLQDLRGLYNDDNIIKLLNTVSDNNKNKIPMAQDGILTKSNAPAGIGNIYANQAKGLPLAAPIQTPNNIQAQTATNIYNQGAIQKDRAAAAQKFKPAYDALNVAAAVPLIGAPAGALVAGMDLAQGNLKGAAINMGGALTGGVGKTVTGAGSVIAKQGWNTAHTGLDLYAKKGALGTAGGYLGAVNPAPQGGVYAGGIPNVAVQDSITSGVNLPKPISLKKKVSIPTMMKQGGLVNGMELELDEKDLKKLKKLGYEFEEI